MLEDRVMRSAEIIKYLSRDEKEALKQIMVIIEESFEAGYQEGIAECQSNHI